MYLLFLFLVATILANSQTLGTLKSFEDLLYNDTILDNYAIVIDAGSTGSRAFVYKFSKYVIFERPADDRNITSTPCGKARPGLSTFTTHPDDTVAYITPLLMNAAEVIPPDKHKYTKIYIKGTAGMRVLENRDQLALWKVLSYGLNGMEKFPFTVKKETCFGTIDGYREAYYAVLSSNYLEGTIDGNLK